VKSHRTAHRKEGFAIDRQGRGSTIFQDAIPDYTQTTIRFKARYRGLSRHETDEWDEVRFRRECASGGIIRPMHFHEVRILLIIYNGM
jgi:hypothetical protein